MERWELVARESIRDLVARYNANADSGRFDQVLECFAPDAVMELDGRPYRGRDEIRTIFTGAAEMVTRGEEPILVRHHTTGGDTWTATVWSAASGALSTDASSWTERSPKAGPAPVSQARRPDPLAVSDGRAGGLGRFFVGGRVEMA